MSPFFDKMEKELKIKLKNIKNEVFTFNAKPDNTMMMLKETLSPIINVLPENIVFYGNKGILENNEEVKTVSDLDHIFFFFVTKNPASNDIIIKKIKTEEIVKSEIPNEVQNIAEEENLVPSAPTSVFELSDNNVELTKKVIKELPKTKIALNDESESSDVNMVLYSDEEDDGSNDEEDEEEEYDSDSLAAAALRSGKYQRIKLTTKRSNPLYNQIKEFTDEEREFILKLKRKGVAELFAIQVFLACDKNKDVTLSCLNVK